MNMSKEESIIWVNHGLAYFESIGKKQKDFAEYLELEASRMSDLKNRKNARKLHKYEIEKIIKLCGYPRREPGRFEYAELYESIEDFFKQFIPVTENRYHQIMFRHFSDEKTVESVLEGCVFENDIREKNIATINGLVRSNEFSEICKVELNVSKVELESISSLFGVVIKDDNTFRLLDQLRSLIHAQPSFYFGSLNNERLYEIVIPEPVVITGSRIIAMMPNNQHHDYPVNNTIAKHCSSVSSTKGIPNLDHWKDIRVEVYLSENMNYHLLIHMSREHIEPKDLNDYQRSTIPSGYDFCNYDAEVKEMDRIAVIKKVNSRALIEQVFQLTQWQGLEEHSFYELKQNIAKSGGHVPGAKVLL